jgi:hypothetical protein
MFGTFKCVARLGMSLYFLQNAYMHFIRPELISPFIEEIRRLSHIPALYQPYIIHLITVIEVFGALLLLSPKSAHIRQGASLLIAYLMAYNISVNGQLVYYSLINAFRRFKMTGKLFFTLSELQRQDQFFRNVALIAGLAYIAYVSELHLSRRLECGGVSGILKGISSRLKNE